MRNNIPLSIYRRSRRACPKPSQAVVLETVEMTAANSGMMLTFALSYGGRQEITHMARELVRQAKLGTLEENEVDEALVASFLPSSFLPDPDLLIRTSGESRISNFFLWQAAYTEIEFEAKAWPDFHASRSAPHSWCIPGSRERRFGRTSEQISIT